MIGLRLKDTPAASEGVTSTWKSLLRFDYLTKIVVPMC